MTPDRPDYSGLWSSCQLNQINFLFGKKKHYFNCSMSHTASVCSEEMSQHYILSRKYVSKCS